MPSKVAIPCEMISLPMYTQDDEWSCGVSGISQLITVFRKPLTILRDLKKGGVISVDRLHDSLRVEQWIQSITGFTVRTKGQPPPGKNDQSKITAYLTNRSAQGSPMATSDKSTKVTKAMSEVPIHSTPDQRRHSRSSSQQLTGSPMEWTRSSGQTAESPRQGSPDTPTRQRFERGDSYLEILSLERAQMPLPGTLRTEHLIRQRNLGLWVPPMCWLNDTFDLVGNRPMPNMPQGWTSWDDYDALMRDVDRANEGYTVDQATRRRELSRRRGKTTELMEIDMATGKAREQK
ncbi:hypothetical protein F5Y07DRAFT_402581 [Xylaria sp. FL0933]|nr:hypothetical protein F5Y07DRAFT_402581 [Xylaria sp. FL0933]